MKHIDKRLERIEVHTGNVKNYLYNSFFQTDLEYQSCASGCKTTCDGILKDESCSLEQNEGCYCPEHHVFYSNGTCIPERNCLICDEEGHVEGDKWNIDKCTACSCANKTVTCRKTDCPVLSTICEDKYTPVLVASSEDDCCQKYSCGMF